MKDRVRKKIYVAAVNFLLCVFAFSAFYPFLLMFFGSWKTAAEFSSNPGGWPRVFTTDNYKNLFLYNGGALLWSYFVSIFVAICYTLIAAVICTMAAFAFSKYNFKGRDALFIMLLCTMALPIEVLIPPLYLMMSRLNLIDTYVALILPGVANVFGMYLLRQYMLGIHDSILEAARIDGASEWKLFTRVMLPMAAPAIGAFCILVGLAKFNEYMWPSFAINSPSRAPIMILLPMLTTATAQSTFSKPWELIMAGCVIATLPLMVLFLVFQDKIMSSVTLGAVKE